MIAVAMNALYTIIFRRGTKRQLSGEIIICVVFALLMLPAIFWHELRFDTMQASISVAEVQVMLVYIMLCGWILPLSTTVSYCLFTLPRTSTTSVKIPSQKRNTRLNTANALRPPRHQPGVLAPFVYSEDRPWGWLEYRGGRFQGQRLALKRAIATLGRDEDNDIWLDDALASRHHAESPCAPGKAHITA